MPVRSSASPAQTFLDAAGWNAQRPRRDILVDAVGHGEHRAYTFRPAGEFGQRLPLVVFLHGWRGVNPRNFGALIDLLVTRGAVVIYPVYQDEGDRTPPRRVTDNARHAVKAALGALEAQAPGLVDSSGAFYWGFSMGAAISVNFALNARTWGLPEPLALMLVAPGDAYHVAHGLEGASILGRLEALRVEAPILIVTGTEDTAIGVPTARAWAARLCHIPSQRRALWLLPAQKDAGQAVRSGHGSPGSPDTRFDFPDPSGAVPGVLASRDEFESSESLNVLDFHGYWRLTVALQDYAAGGRFPTWIFGAEDRSRLSLGHWSTGRALEPAIAEDPCHVRR